MIKKWRLNKLLDMELEFDIGEDKKYRVETIKNNAVFSNAVAEDQSSKLHFLLFWKSYLEKEDIWEPTLVVIYLWKMIGMIHKNHPKKPIATFPPFDSVLSIVKPVVQPIIKCKQSWPAEDLIKPPKK